MATQYARIGCTIPPRLVSLAVALAIIATLATPSNARDTNRLGPLELLVRRPIDGVPVTPASRNVHGRMVDGWTAVATFTPFFPATFADPFVVEGAGVRVVLRPLDAANAPAEVEDGRVVYRNAYIETDSVHSITAMGSEEILLLRSPDAPTRFAYEISAVEGASQVSRHAGAVRFTDDQGRGLEIEAPWVVDSTGMRHEGAVRWVLGKQQPDGTRRLTLVLDPRGLEYPLAIDPSWTFTGSPTGGRGGATATLMNDGRVLVAGNSSTAITAEIFDPRTGTWSSTANMTRARALHMATLLPNGKVLLAGGQFSSGTAELYDPNTGTWSFTGSLSAARQAATMTLLANGKVLVVGGDAGIILRSAEIYDPGTGAWTATPNMAFPRTQHRATLLGNGKVLVTGGALDFSTAELFDPTTGTWTTAANMISPRSLHMSILLPNGKVLVSGGWNNGNEQANAELFDPSSGTWTATGSMTVPRTSHTATLLPNGKVLVAGGTFTGASAEIYDPGTGTWTATTSLNSANTSSSMTLLPSGKVLGVGGAGAEIYDPITGFWSAATSLGNRRFGHTGTLLPTGKLLVTGGFTAVAAGNTATAELFDPVTGNWTATGSMTTPRAFHTATLLPTGKVLVTGGTSTLFTPLLTAELYDPFTGTWTATGSMASVRMHHTATLLSHGLVLVAGGYAGLGPLSGAELYDPAAGIWTATGNLGAVRSSHAAALLANGKVLVAGGSGTATVLASAELYDPTTGAWSATDSLGSTRESLTITLLQSGRVLATGGQAFGVSRSSSELYDPVAGTWSATGSMTTARNRHTATLLPSGRVLVTGGRDTAPDGTSVEVFEPATGLWTSTGALSTARASHTAALLPTGQVFVVGGRNTGGVLASTEFHTEDFQPGARPDLTTVTSPILLGSPITANGTQFRGISEAGSGHSTDSPTNYPLLQLRSLESGWTRFLPVDPATGWSSTAFESLPLYDFPVGYAFATVFANGLQAESAIVPVVCPGEVFELGDASYWIAESGGSITITVTRQGGCAASVSYATSDNTALAASDYTATSGTLTFAANETSKTFSVPIRNDTSFEGNESFNLTLSAPTMGAALGERRRAVVTIVDGAAGELDFSVTPPVVNETAGTATVTVVRMSGSEGKITVPWSIASNTATLGTDTSGATSGTLTFGSGVTSATFTIAVTNDATAEGNESLLLRLGTPAGGATLGARSHSILTIVDDDVPASGVTFSATSFWVRERSSATITISRTSSVGTQTVTFSTSDNGTARAGTDYTATTQNVTFNPGETSKTVSVPVADDAAAPEVEGDESVNLTLTSSVVGALGAQRTALLIISDDDYYGTLHFQSMAFTAGETAGTATITVTRVGGSVGNVSVDVFTGNNTATSGTDYTPVSTTISFAAGVTSRTFRVTILNDSNQEGSESVNLTLTNPRNGAVLDTARRAVLIVDDDEVP